MRPLVIALMVLLTNGVAAQALDSAHVKRLLDSNSCKQCDLAGAILAKTELSGANLSGANLAGANLQDATLIRADLTGANLAGADLTGAVLLGAFLNKVDLTDATLKGARLSGANLFGAKGLTQKQLDSACGQEPGAIYDVRLPGNLQVRSCK